MRSSRGFISLVVILGIIIGLAALGGVGWYVTKHRSVSSMPNGTGAGTTTDSVPYISSISPTSGSVGTSVVLSGTGFASQHEAILFDGNLLDNIATTSDTELYFEIPSYMSNPCTPTGGVACSQVAFPVPIGVQTSF